jgi:hypothetical protein
MNKSKPLAPLKKTQEHFLYMLVLSNAPSFVYLLCSLNFSILGKKLFSEVSL